MQLHQQLSQYNSYYTQNTHKIVLTKCFIGTKLSSVVNVVSTHSYLFLSLVSFFACKALNRHIYK